MILNMLVKAKPNHLLACKKMSFGTLYTHKVRSIGPSGLSTGRPAYSPVQVSPRATGILAVAKAQGLSLDVVYADQEEKENHDKLLQVNPLGQVPVFVGKDGHIMTECIPIALYLASQSDNTKLLGSTRQEYYEIIKWMSLANSDLLPAIGGIILPLIGRPIDVRKDKGDCLRIVYRDCELLETHLQGQKYLVGDRITLADFFAVGVLVGAFMVFHKVLHAKHPRLTEWFNEVYALPSFKSIAGELRLLDIPAAAFPEL